MRRVLVAIAIAAAAAGLAACDTGGQPAEGTPTQNAQDAGLEFTRCMREHGVNLPDPGPDGRIRLNQSQTDPARYGEALQACGSLLSPEGPADVQIPAEEKQRLLDLAACIRDQGFAEFPDPDFSGGQMVFGGPGVDLANPDFQAAMRSCERQVGLNPPGQGG